MIKQLPKILILALAVVPFISPNLRAQQDDDSRRLPAGSITDDTFVFAELDLAAIDVAAIFEQFAEAGGEAPPAIRSTVGAFVQSLRDAGVAQVYATVPSRWLVDGGVCVLIPCRDVDAVERLATGVVAMLPPEPGYTLVKRDAMVIVCPKAAAAFFESVTGDADLRERPEMAAALASIDGLPHRLVVDLPEELQREIAELWPNKLPLTAGVSISPQQLMREIRTVAIGFGLPPEERVEMRIACVDREGAQVVQQQIERLLRIIPEEIPHPMLSVEDATVIARLSDRDLATLRAALLGPIRQRTDSHKTLAAVRSVTIALHNFESAYGYLPGKYTVDAERRPLLSWRVLLLPFLGHAPLYERFKKDEPWDSPHNRVLIAEMPAIFAIPGDALPEGMTRIRLPVIDGGIWAGDGPPRTFEEIPDGLSNTIWVAIAPESAAVEWTKPDDWELDPEHLIESFFGDAEMTIVGFADAQVRAISKQIGADVLKALLTMAGGEAVRDEEVK